MNDRRHAVGAIARTLVLAMLLALASPQPKAGQAAEVVTDGITGFGIKLYQYLGEDNDENLIISPLSIALALGMVLPGADDEAADELREVLGVVDTDSADRGLSSLQKAMKKRNETDGVTLNIANGGFVHRDLQLNPAYVDRLSQWYGLGMQPVDYNEPEAARETINVWVAQRTNDLIEELLPEGSVDRQARLTLVNAIYLLAEWQHTFDEAQTSGQPFFFMDGTEDEVPTMRGSFTVPVVIGEDYQAVELPYRGGELAMLIVVPDDDLSAFEQGLSAERLQMIVDNLDTRSLELWLPKVEARFNSSLREALERLSVQRLFCGPCNPLAEIAPPAELSVFDVMHETYLRMDETGTEAAAATGVVVGVTSVPAEPLTFRVDRPYLMALRDRATGALLFLGRVTDPR